MNAKRRVDRTHADFREYDRLFCAIWDEMEEKCREEKRRMIAEYGELCGMDGQVVVIQKEYMGKIKKLQEKYAHLFCDEVGG